MMVPLPEFALKVELVKTATPSAPIRVMHIRREELGSGSASPSMMLTLLSWLDL